MNTLYPIIRARKSHKCTVAIGVFGFIRRTAIVSAATVFLLALPVLAEASWSGKNTRVSISSNGPQGNGHSSPFNRPSISANGRYVAFYSEASNLVSGDTNGFSDVFVHDRETREIERVSVASDGTEGNRDSSGVAISGDGRYVAFESSADLVTGHTSNTNDVFVHDRRLGETKLINVASDGTPGNNGSTAWDRPSISADGQFIAFCSSASNLTVENDINSGDEIFVRDHKNGTTELISVSVDGTTGNGISDHPSISADARYVAFASNSNNLVPGDTTGYWDIFVRDRENLTTEWISVPSDGTQGNGHSFEPTISADGRYVVFHSTTNNLIPGETLDARNIYLHDRETRKTEHISLDPEGNQPNSNCYSPSISADGRYVAFSSIADNLVPGDANQSEDVFIRDRAIAKTYCLSVASDKRSTANNGSHGPVINAGGKYVAFVSKASNLIPGDSNDFTDVFVSSRNIFNFSPISILLLQSTKQNN